jgi:hypothetical protein
MAAGLVDDREWPLVVVRWPAEVATDDEVAEVLAGLSRAYGQKHVVLHDGIRSGGLSANGRRALAAHSAQNEDEIRRWVLASAAVAPSAFTRTLIKTVQWMAPPPCPFRAFGREEEAREWLLQALRRAGLWRPSASP